MLPLELLARIVGQVGRLDLMKLREICKAFERAANPFLFDRVTVWPDLKALDIVRSTIEKFGPSIRLLTYYPIVQRQLTRTEYSGELFFLLQNIEKCDDCAESSPEKCRTGYCMITFIQEYQKTWYDAYKKRADTQIEMLHNGEYIARLCCILKSAPTIRKLVIGNVNCDYLIRRKRHLASESKTRAPSAKARSFSMDTLTIM